MARSWILDLKDRRTRVNAVSPGLVETAGIHELFGGGEGATATKGFLASPGPAGRIGQPEDIAKVVLFLVSDDASYINGIECSSTVGRPRSLPWHVILDLRDCLGILRD